MDFKLGSQSRNGSLPRSVVEQAAAMAKLISPKRTKNVNELQVAVVQWELTLVEHQSRFSEVVADSVKTAAMRAMLAKDILERFLDGPFHYEELRNRVSADVGVMIQAIVSCIRQNLRNSLLTPT